MTIGHVHLNPQFVQAVRDALDIVPVAEEHTRLQRRGDRLIGLCPLHKEKTPSFSVEPVQGLFYCFGCGLGGDAIKLHMMLTGDDFPGAMEALARRFGVPLPTRAEGGVSGEGEGVRAALEAAQVFFADSLERAGEPRDYLRRRGVPDELVSRYELGFAPEAWGALMGALRERVGVKALASAGLVAPSTHRPGEHYDRFRHRLIFPIHTPSGRLVGFGGRTLGDDRAKYINSQETASFRKKSLLYGLRHAKRSMRETGQAILVEGYFDVLGLAVAGIEGAVASMGTSLTEEQAVLLARYADEVVVGYDGDEAGWTAYRRALPMLLAKGLTVRRLLLDSGEDPDSVRVERGAAALVAMVAEAPDAVEHELEALIPGEAPTSPREQAGSADRVAELLGPVPDAVLRYAYGRRAAERLGLPFDLLAARLGRGTRARRRPEPEPTEAVQRRPGQDLELATLGALFSLLETSDPSSRLSAARDLAPADVFWDPDARNIWQAFCDLYREGSEAPSMASLRSRLEPGGTAVDLMARVLIEGADSPTASRTAVKGGSLEGALASLQRRWLDQRRKDLSREINEAQRQGDDERLLRLVDEQGRLSRRVHLGET